MTLRRAIGNRLTRGFEFVNERAGRATRWSLQPYPPLLTLDAEITRLLRVTGATTVVDVGAHEGGFARSLRRSGFNGPIVSFEPHPGSFTALEGTAGSDPNWHVRRYALGNETGDAQLNEFDRGGGQFNSLRALGPHAQVYEPGLHRSGATTVPVRRLADVWPFELAEPARTLLKTDTQGHDLEVLAGAGDLLREIPAIVMEVAVQPLYDGAPVIHEVFARLTELGYEPTGTFPIRRYGGGARVIEFDCTFVRPACG
jgi:FkbM family methyltransferase